LSIGELRDISWLSSNTIDLVVSQFAKCYPDVDFLSISFLYLALNSKNPQDLAGATDILGNILEYKFTRSIVFISNAANIHWTLIRVVFLPEPSLELFEPMGKPVSRNGSLSFRYVPRSVVQWLDACCPLPSGGTWLSVSSSAITSRHQYTSFDCGVACLLYAEKCGLGQVTN
jgi:hypothetical protein